MEYDGYGTVALNKEAMLWTEPSHWDYLQLSHHRFRPVFNGRHPSSRHIMARRELAAWDKTWTTQVTIGNIL